MALHGTAWRDMARRGMQGRGIARHGVPESRTHTSRAEADDPVDRITRLVRYIFEALQNDRIFWGLFYSLRSQPAVMAVLGDPFRLWTGRLRDLFVTNFREAGGATPEVDALILYSLIEGTIQQYLLDPETYPLDTISERIVEQFGRPSVS